MYCVCGQEPNAACSELVLVTGSSEHDKEFSGFVNLLNTYWVIISSRIDVDVPSSDWKSDVINEGGGDFFN
jgi:hypothetical protein